MKPAKAYIIDLDGTILDSCGDILGTKLTVLDTMNIPLPDIDHLASMNGMRLEDTFILSTGIDDPAIQREAVSLYHPLFLKSTLKNLKIFAGATETLATLRKRGAKIGIVSMRRAAELDTIVRASGLDKFADAWVSEYAVDRPKPAPDMVIHLMKMFDVDPADTVVVGDTIYDLEMASSCGARAVGFTLGAQSARMLGTRRPEALIDDFQDLLNI